MRSDEGAFVVEGPLLLAEAQAAHWEIEGVYVPEGAPGPAGLGDVPLHRLAPGVLERVATTEVPRPVLAVVRRREPPEGRLDAADFVVVADRVADPGNLGTILRSAEAAGAEVVALTPGSVDPFNPKALRASAGALFHVPVAVDVEWQRLRRHGRVLCGTSSRAGVPYDEADLRGPVALVVGNEAHGVDDCAPIDVWLTIPHRGRAESLNVAMAATVLCFEVARQRRHRPDSVG